jgi:hypothetical protein
MLTSLSTVVSLAFSARRFFCVLRVAYVVNAELSAPPIEYADHTPGN